MREARSDQKKRTGQKELIDRCLAAFVESGTLDLSLDQLAKSTGTSKRMLVHYFGGRENIEEQAVTRLEEKLREQFAPESFPSGVSPQTVMKALWERTTAPEAQGVLRLVMDLSRRAWSGSPRAREFYEEQRRLWVILLLNYFPDESLVEDVLQLFQGAVVSYLVSGDPKPGMRALMRAIRNDAV